MNNDFHNPHYNVLVFLILIVKIVLIKVSYKKKLNTLKKHHYIWN